MAGPDCYRSRGFQPQHMRDSEWGSKPAGNCGWKPQLRSGRRRKWDTHQSKRPRPFNVPFSDFHKQDARKLYWAVEDKQWFWLVSVVLVLSIAVLVLDRSIIIR